MSTPRGPVPGEPAPRPDRDAALDAMLDYLMATALAPAPDLTARIQARIAREPDRTPPRRFVLALVHLRIRSATGALRQLVRVSGGRGGFSTLVRVQAIGLVLVTVLCVGAVGVGAAMGVAQLLADRDAPLRLVPTPTRPARVDVSPSPTPQATPVVSPGVPIVEPTPEDPRPTSIPERTRRADPTPRTTAAPATAPRRTPRPTPTPRRTTRPTLAPQDTERPERTDRPEGTDQPESTETPEPDDDDDGHGSDGDDAG